jgi:hypothetical protein
MFDRLLSGTHRMAVSYTKLKVVTIHSIHIQMPHNLLEHTSFIQIVDHWSWDSLPYSQDKIHN